MSINFVSKSNLDECKRERKQNLERKLYQAKDEYEYSKRKRLIEDERGDSKWILPSLEKRIGNDESAQKKNKKKHKKKSKNHDKKKSEDDDEWEEAEQSNKSVDVKESNASYQTSIETTESSQTQSNICKREEWMLASSLLDIAMSSSSHRENKTKIRKKEEQTKKEEERKSLYTSRELNPYWKDGGTGLPSEVSDNQEKNKTNAQVPKYVEVGDGGQSWIEKAYKRSKLQAEEEGVPLEEIVARRWGSMAKLTALLKASKNSSRHNQNSKHASSGWRKTSNNQSHSLQKSNDLETLTKSDQNQEQRTTCHVKESKIVEKVCEENLSLKENAPIDHSSSENRSPEPNLPVRVPLTDKEKNEVSAKMLRAELMGNTALYTQLKLELQQGRLLSVAKAPNNLPKVEEVLLTRTDKHGNLYPVMLHHDTKDLMEKKKAGKKKLISMHDPEGNRMKYFEDDDSTSLKTMVERERLTTADEQHAMMHRMASKHLGTTMDDDYTVDDMFVTASATKGISASEEKRTISKAIAEHQLREKQLNSCRFCFDNPNLSKHLIVAIGVKAYLALPINASLTDGHCLILPMQHIAGQSFMDEDVLQEVKLFKQALTRMFSNNDEDVLFIESCKNIHRQNHCSIECIPVPKEVGEMAPIYFKKAITESESEWSQNKKLVTLTSKGGVSKAVPKGLPYFAVEFGLDGGFAHVIEDERLFPSNFGKEIIAGIMDLEVRLWRNPPRESFDQHKRKVMKFSEQWKPFDWTQDLK